MARARTGGPLTGLEVPDSARSSGRKSARSRGVPSSTQSMRVAQIGEREREPDADARSAPAVNVAARTFVIIRGDSRPCGLAAALGPVGQRPAEAVSADIGGGRAFARPELQNPVVAVAREWSLNGHEPEDHAEIRQIFLARLPGMSPRKTRVPRCRSRRGTGDADHVTAVLATVRPDRRASAGRRQGGGRAVRSVRRAEAAGSRSPARPPPAAIAPRRRRFRCRR